MISGPTIKVASGKYVNVAFIGPDDIDIESIAQSLAMTTRFRGHIPRFYSVAEHSLHCMWTANRFGVPRTALLAILMHDAAEAYIGDLPKPLKQLVPDFVALENQIHRAIGAKYGIDFELHHATVKRFDNMLLKAERMAFWPDDHSEWEGLGSIEDAAVPFSFYGPETGKEAFLRSARTLGVRT